MTITIPADRSRTGTFKIRTQSRRRFIVIDTSGRYTVKRTDNRTTADKVRYQDPFTRVVFDTATGELVTH